MGNVARRARPEYAARLIPAWVERYSDDGEPRWVEAIQGTGECLRPEAVKKTVDEWISQDFSTLSNRAHAGWCLAIQATSSRMESIAAWEYIRGCVENSVQATDRRGSLAWAAAAAGAARALPSVEAFLVVKHLLEREDWRRFSHVIRNASGCVDPLEADKLAFYLFGHLESAKDHATWTSLVSAVAQTMQRIEEGNAEEWVGRLIRACDVGAILPTTYSLAVEAAASRLPRRQAAAAICDWINCFHRAASPASGLLLAAIAAAATNVSPISVLPLIRRLLKERAVTEDDRWSSAIRNAARRIAPVDVRETVELLLPCYQRSGGGDKLLLREAIELAAAHADGNTALSLCQELIATGLSTAALAAAKANGLAVVERPLQDAATVDMAGAVLPSYEVCRRDQLVLDVQWVAAGPVPIARIPSDGIAESGSALESAMADGEVAKRREVAGAGDQRFVFRRRRANVWEFAFETEAEVIGKDLKGFQYLARLIDQPRTSIPAVDLVLADAPEGIRKAADRDVGVEVADEDTTEFLKPRRREIEELLRVEDDPDLRQELQEIDDYLRRARRPGGKPATLNQTESGKAAKAVQIRISTALKALRDGGMERLADHLADCSRMENYHFEYRRKDAPAWDVSWLLPTDRVER